LPHETIFHETELFIEHMGLKVYRTYQDDDFTKPEPHHFTLDPNRPRKNLEITCVSCVRRAGTAL